MSVIAEKSTGRHCDPAIHDQNPESDLDDLRARIVATRFPKRRPSTTSRRPTAPR